MLLSKKEREEIIKKINNSVSGWLAVILLFAIAALFFFLKLLFIAITITIILYLVYFIVLLALKGLSEDELLNLPKGHILLGVAKSLGFYK